MAAMQLRRHNKRTSKTTNAKMCWNPVWLTVMVLLFVVLIATSHSPQLSVRSHALGHDKP